MGSRSEPQPKRLSMGTPPSVVKVHVAIVVIDVILHSIISITRSQRRSFVLRTSLKQVVKTLHYGKPSYSSIKIPALKEALQGGIATRIVKGKIIVSLYIILQYK